MGRRRRDEIPPTADEIEMYDQEQKEMNNHFILEDISDIITNIYNRLEKLEKGNNEK